MGTMKNIYIIIEEKYPNKKEELITDFQEWINAVRALPRTKEVREIISEIKEV